MREAHQGKEFYGQFVGTELSGLLKPGSKTSAASLRCYREARLALFVAIDHLSELSPAE